MSKIDDYLSADKYGRFHMFMRDPYVLSELAIEDDGLKEICESDEFTRVITANYLHLFIDDENEETRMNVARRIDELYLLKMTNDESDKVREIIVKRIDKKYLFHFYDDKNKKIKIIALSRSKSEKLLNIIKDEKDPIILFWAIVHYDDHGQLQKLTTLENNFLNYLIYLKLNGWIDDQII